MHLQRVPFSIWLAALVTIACPAVVLAEDEAVAQAKALSRAFRGAAERTQPSVVMVISRYDLTGSAAGDLGRIFGDPQLRELFPRRPGMTPDEEGGAFRTNVGSGVITSSDGLILTNNHVVENADQVIIRLRDGTELPADEIRRDPLSDLAILRVKSEEPLPSAKLGDSNELEIGDWVIAIGSPFELESTVSAGIISGKKRGIARIQRGRLLQTDAAINPGNSGGPLVGLNGEVVGINTAIATNNGGYQGIGFAIPINRAKWVTRELLEYGKVRRAYLGIRIGELDAPTGRRLDVAARSGVLVVEVLSDSPADDAGLKNDDVIVEFAGMRVRAPGDLQEAVEQKDIGSEQKMGVMRRGKRINLNVTMVSLPDEPPVRRPGLPEDE
jgi:serine protease Do